MWEGERGMVYVVEREIEFDSVCVRERVCVSESRGWRERVGVRGRINKTK